MKINAKMLISFLKFKKKIKIQNKGLDTVFFVLYNGCVI